MSATSTPLILLARDTTAEDVSNIRTTICVGFAGFTILVYDHMITFADEVQYVWGKPKGPLVYLFLLNRYLIPLGFILNLFAYLWPDWNATNCATFVKYEGSLTVIGINVVALIMLLRIRAIYHHNHYVVAFVAIVLAVELGVNAWLLSNGQAVSHPGVDHPPCTMVFAPKLKDIASASAWLPLLYDTIVFLLTFYRVMQVRSKKTFRSPIIEVVWNEGLLYYSVICSITLVLTIMIKVAPPNLQNITAQLELLLTVAMMSRITIDLKKQSRKFALNLGSPKPVRSAFASLGAPPVSENTMMFQPQETQHSLAESTRSRVSLSRSQPRRFWSSFTAGDMDREGGYRTQGTSAPMSRPDALGDADTKDSKAWVELSNLRPPGES